MHKRLIKVFGMHNRTVKGQNPLHQFPVKNFSDKPGKIMDNDLLLAVAAVTATTVACTAVETRITGNQ